MLNGCFCPISCGVRSQVAGAEEILKVGSELALFPLSVCSSPSQLLHPAVLVQEGLLKVVSKVWDVGCGSLAAVRNPDCL